MTDLHGRGALAGAAPKIAIGAAIAALLTSLIAVIVVMGRSGEGDAAPAAGSAGSARGGGRAEAEPTSGEQRVAAADVVKLKREAVTAVRDPGSAPGVKVVDDALQRSLGLEADDVITAISGRSLRREFDVFEAMLGVTQLNPSVVYVDLVRGGKAVTLRWRVDGDLRAARRADTLGALGSRSSLGSLSGGTVSGGLIDSTSPYDSLGSPPDPLVDTIKKLDDHTFEVPRSTAERAFASTSSYARLARVLPSYRGGGFRLYAIRPGTLVSAIGVQNGDTVRAINGHEVNTVDEVIELYQQIKDAKEWKIDVTRRGRPEQITIKIQ